MATTKTFPRQITSFLFSMILFIGFDCVPEKQITDKNYKIDVTLESSKVGKLIADNTALLLVQKGKTDSLKTYTTNGLANFSFKAPENTGLEMIIHIYESVGHQGIIHTFTTAGDKSIKLRLDAKNWSVPISFNTTKEETPIGNIEYLINPGNITGEMDSNGNKLIPFTLNTNNYNEPLDTDASFDFTKTATTKDMHYDRTILKQGENKFTFDLTKESWEHYFNVNTSGNIKTPLLTESIGTISYDNKTKNFDPNTGIVSFVSDDEVENEVIVGVSNVPGYENGEITVNNIGSRTKNGETHNIVLEGLTYNATQPIIVNNGKDPIPGATITYTFKEETGEKNTDENGKTNITFENLETDINNLPLDEYLLQTTTTKTGYPESVNNFNISSGLNDQISISMGANKYWMTGEVIPSGSNIKGWKGGNIIFNTTGGNFATDTIQSTTEPYTLDSLTVKKDGFIPEKILNLSLNKNAVTTQNVILEEETPTEYTYWLAGVGTPNNATATGWKNGITELTGTVNNGTYQTNQLVNTEETFTLDSIVFNSPGFIKQKLTNQTLTQNQATTKNFALEEETYNFRFIGNNTSPNGTNIEVWEEGNNIANGVVSGTSYTTNEWESTLSNMNIDSIVFKANGHIPQTFVNINVNPGDNTQNATLQEEAPTEYTYWIEGTGTTPANNTTVKGYLNGEIFTANTSSGAFETNHVNKTEQTITLDSLVFTAPGYIKHKEENFIMNPNGTNKNGITLQEEPTTYTTSITGKVLDLTKQRVKNRTDALVITNATGTEYKFNIDENGEFSGDIVTNSPDEIVTAHWNETTMSDYDKNTISFNKDNETYPIDRVIAGDYKPYDETTLVNVDVSKLDDDYLRVYAGKDVIVNDEILKFAIKGGAQNPGSFNYGRREPLRPFVYTLLPDGTTTVSSADQADMELAVDQGRNIFYNTETGWAIPVNNRESGTDFGTRSGRWAMRQIPNTGYWNGGYMITGETNLLEGGEAQVDGPVSESTGYLEIIGPWIRDGPNGSNQYCSTWNDGNPTLTDLGKAHMSITTDFPAGSGKE